MIKEESEKYGAQTKITQPSDISHIMGDGTIVVDIARAIYLGLNESIVWTKIYFLISGCEKKEKNFFEGRYWTYSSIEDWQSKFFPFWSIDTVKRTFSKLRSDGLLLAKKHNPDKTKHLLYYSLDLDLWNGIVPKKRGVCTKGLVQNAPIEKCKMPQSMRADLFPMTVRNESNIKKVDSADASNKYKSSKFTKPTITQITEYIQEKSYTLDAYAFHDFYESKGWLIGKSPMKCWKAAIRTWNRNKSKFDDNESSSSDRGNGAIKKYSIFKTTVSHAEFDKFKKECEGLGLEKEAEFREHAKELGYEV